VSATITELGRVGQISDAILVRYPDSDPAVRAEDLADFAAQNLKLVRRARHNVKRSRRSTVVVLYNIRDPHLAAKTAALPHSARNDTALACASGRDEIAAEVQTQLGITLPGPPPPQHVTVAVVHSAQESRSLGLYGQLSLRPPPCR